MSDKRTTIEAYKYVWNTYELCSELTLRSNVPLTGGPGQERPADDSCSSAWAETYVGMQLVCMSAVS